MVIRQFPIEWGSGQENICPSVELGYRLGVLDGDEEIVSFVDDTVMFVYKNRFSVILCVSNPICYDANP